MNHCIQETKNFFSSLKFNKQNNTHLIIFPSFLSLKTAVKFSKNLPISIGSQNFYCEHSGAYTGEVSLKMLAEINISNVLIGHSERRIIFNENDALINKKLLYALNKNFSPTLCIGETADQRNSGEVKKTLSNQLTNALQGVLPQNLNKIIIAYEPIWAIGTGITATSSQAQETHQFIRSFLAEKYNPQIAQKTIIQYGGSVKPSNIKNLIAQPDIDGALIGGASLSHHDFLKIINEA